MSSSVELSVEAKELIKQYDLTSKIIPFLDRHLMYPLLDFYSNKGIYDQKVIQQMIYDLFRDVNMADFTESMWKKLNEGNQVPEEFATKKTEILETIIKYEEETAKIREVLKNPELVTELKQDKKANLELLDSKYGITSDMLKKLYEFGQYQYNCGNYSQAHDLLYHFRALSNDAQLCTSATWGIVASEIFSEEWSNALAEIQRLRESIDSRSSTDPLTQLYHRSWIIHWYLFPFFNTEKGKEAMCDLFFTSSYMSTIQASCPWILRYLSVAIISSNERGNNSNNSNYQKRLRDLVRVIGVEQYEYQDPITEFVRALYIDYDFEQAHAKLAEAEIILKNDFFLIASAESFLQAARYMISEVYCRIHQRIDIGQLFSSLNLSKDEGEKWIANQTKYSKNEAKIDESEGTVTLNRPIASVYQQVIEKTKGLSFRSNQLLTQAINKPESM
ncbi:eukaryotic translation initiation factor 3 subunit E [Nadsonia fulvescens var. elongata DSM 6958]|uniref:Eukaryotic translation initiation factor 3 subunit E n=1 Tax=Nadsonia fulvescens var. elongata DSM 6958 TaxID=857566 RepID=A0A1E3PJ91_9ASCO|nr:eukaryotic translation initiation factor 3 subunit E [Nadsonia fulvescens var. elongata DSM 6958]